MTRRRDSDAVVAVGAVDTKDVTPFTVAVGNLSKSIKKRVLVDG